MLRALYIVLLRLHPPNFREQFAGEMLWIFDQTASSRSRALFADALRSLVTQWMFRGDFDEQPSFAGMGGPSPDRVPAFYTSGSDIPPPGALLNGLILSVVVFGLACFALAHSGGHPQVFTYYGSEFHAGPPMYGPASGPAATGSPSRAGGAASPGIWARLTSVFRKSPDRGGEATSPPEPRIAEAVSGPGHGSDEPTPTLILMSRTKALAYFNSIPVLAALDTNADGELSPEEIGVAPIVLATLDKNHDGKLDAEECGYRPHKDEDTRRLPRKSSSLPYRFEMHPNGVLSPKGPPETKADDPVERRARIDFMRLEPVLAALDADHDTVISAAEISNASAALKTLDRNRDGRLTLEEVVPEPVTREVAAIFRLDTDFDGKISQDERQNPFGRHVAMLLDAADHNGNRDGNVTWEELTKEIRRRADLNHDGVVTWEELMKARASGALNGPPREPWISRLGGR